MTASDQFRRREVERQLHDLFGRSAAFQSLPDAERRSILANTTSVVQTMAENRAHQSAPAQAAGALVAAALAAAVAEVMPARA